MPDLYRYYLFFTSNELPQSRADLVQVTNCANAAGNLGYPTVLTYLKRDRAGQQSQVLALAVSSAAARL
jgi:hypothetical protein